MNQTQQQLLQKIADHIGTTAQQAWVILIHMYRIDGIVDLVCGFLFAGVFGVLAIYMGKMSARIKLKDPHDDWEIAQAVCIGALIVGAISLIFTLDSNMLEIIYPRGYALAQLLQKVK